MTHWSYMVVMASVAALWGCSAAPRPCPADARMDRSRSDDGEIVKGFGMTVDRTWLIEPLPLNPRGELRPGLPPTLHSYRVSFSFTLWGGPPYTVRLHDSPEGPLAEIATWYRCQAPNGYGRTFDKRTIHVPRQTWNRLVACIDSSGFWAMPEMHHDSLLTTDGSDVFVEAASGGRYHVVWRRNLNDRGTYGQDPAAAPLKPCLALINQLAGRD